MKFFYLAVLMLPIIGCDSSSNPSDNAAAKPGNDQQPTRESIKIGSNGCPELSGVYSCRGGYGAFNGIYVFSFESSPSSERWTYQITPEGRSPSSYVVGAESSNDGVCQDGELRIFNHDADDSAYGFGAWYENDEFDLQINYYDRNGSNVVAGCKKKNS